MRLGAGPRRLIGSTQRSPRSFTLLEIDGAKLRMAAFQAPDFTRAIAWDTLPERIRTGAAELIRADLVDAELDQLRIGPRPATE